MAYLLSFKHGSEVFQKRIFSPAPAYGPAVGSPPFFGDAAAGRAAIAERAVARGNAAPSAGS